MEPTATGPDGGRVLPEKRSIFGGKSSLGEAALSE
jgi:hypothetical protein